MVLTTNNLYSESYNQIKDFLDSIPSIDPKNRYKTNIVHSSMPNINSKGFSGYPFIVLLIDQFEEMPSFDGQLSEKNFRVQMTIYSNEPTDLDSISDKIVYYYKNENYLTEFQGKELTSSPMDYLMDQKGKKILYRNIWLNFTKRL